MAIEQLMTKIKQAHTGYTDNKTPDNFNNAIKVYCEAIKDFALQEKAGILKIYDAIGAQNELYDEKKISTKLLKETVGIYNEYSFGMFQFVNELKAKTLQVDSEELNRSELIQKLNVAIEKDAPFIDSIFTGDRVETKEYPLSVAVDNLTFASDYCTYINELAANANNINNDNTDNETVKKVICMAKSSVEYFAYMCIVTIIGSFAELQDAITKPVKDTTNENPFKLF